jgi:hypothetical protein
MIFILLFARLLETDSFGSFLTPEIVDQVEAQLSDSCGPDCTSVFRDIVPLLSNSTGRGKLDDFSAFVNGLIAQGNEAKSRILQDMNDLIESSFAHNLTVSSASKTGKSSRNEPPIQPDIPCRTQAECTSLDFKINRCAHVRRNAMKAYVGANAATLVLANLISNLCGCIFAGPVNVCVLQGVPYVCGFPFEAYQGLFSVTSALYTAVQLTTSICPYVGTDLV